METILNVWYYILRASAVIIPAAFLIVCFRAAYYNVKIKLIKRLKYTREFSIPEIFEGEELILTETVYNNSALPVFFADIESYIYGGLKLLNYTAEEDSTMQLVISRFHLMPYMRIRRSHKIKCVRRGYYKLSTARIITGGNAAYFDSEAELYVYPKILSLNQISYPVNYIQGSNVSLRRIITDPFSVSGIRDYGGGDPFNLINFKATAKSGFQGVQNIKVNKLDYCSSRVFIIYINFQKPPEIPVPTNIYESLMEQALSFSASFMNEALHNGYKTGLSANCHLVSGERLIEFPLAGGLYHMEEMLREMAKVRIKSGISFASLLERGLRANIYDGEIFILTLYADQTIDESVAVFKKRNNAVNIIKLENEEYNKYLSSVKGEGMSL